jgi:hypothetical protein
MSLKSPKIRLGWMERRLEKAGDLSVRMKSFSGPNNIRPIEYCYCETDISGTILMGSTKSFVPLEKWIGS